MRLKRFPVQFSNPYFVLAGVFCFHLLVNFVWRSADRSYFGVTHFYYFHALDLFSRLSDGNFVFYPLLHFFTAVCGSLFGFSYMLFGVPGMLSLGVLMGSVFRIGQLCMGTRMGLWAACMVSFVPIVFGSVRCYDYPAVLLAASSLYVCLLLEGRKNKNIWALAASCFVLWCGGIMGGGFSPTETFVFGAGVAGAGLWFVFDCLFCAVRLNDVRRSLADFIVFCCGSVFAAFAVWAVICFFTQWTLGRYFAYIVQQKAVFSDLLADSCAVDWGKSFLVYPVEMFASQLGVLFMAFFAVSLLGFYKRLNRFNLLFVFWFLFPVLLFSFSMKKNSLYTCPVVVPVVLAAFCGIRYFRQNPLFCRILAVLAVGQFFVLSFADVPQIKKICFYPGSIMPLINPVDVDYMRKPTPLHEGAREFALDAARQITEYAAKTGDVKVVAVRSDILMWGLSPVAMEVFFKVRAELPDGFEFFPSGIPVTDSAGFIFAAVSKIGGGDFLLFDEQTRDLFFNSAFGQNYLKPFFAERFTAEIGKGGKIYLFERVKPVPLSSRFCMYTDYTGRKFMNQEILDIEDIPAAVAFIEGLCEQDFETDLKAECFRQAALGCAKVSNAQKSEEFLEKLEGMLPLLKSPDLRCEYTLQIAEISLKNNDRAKSSVYFEKALAMSGQIKDAQKRREFELSIKNQQKAHGL